MRIIIYLFIVLLFFSFSGFSQTGSLTKDHLTELFLKLESFIKNRDSIFTPGRTSELVQLIFETNSDGGIDRIHLFGKESDSIYKIFKELDKEYFNSWKGPDSTIITLPFFYLSENSTNRRNYVDNLYWDHYRKIQNITSQSGRIIMIKWMAVLSPRRQQEKIQN